MFRILALLVLFATAPIKEIEFLDEIFDHDRTHPAAGTWLGTIASQDGPGMLGQVTLERDETGAWTANMTGLGELGEPATELEVEGNAVTFVVETGLGIATFTGEVREEGQRLAGKVVLGDGDSEGTELSFLFARTPRPTDLPAPLSFSGTGTMGDLELDMTLVFARTPGGNWVGHVDILDFEIEAYPLTSIRREGSTLTARMLARQPATITTELKDGDRSLTGQFRQGSMVFDLDLKRGDGSPRPRARRRSGELEELARSSWMLRQQVAPTWALTGGNVIDLASGEIRTGVNIVIEGDTIGSVGPEAPPDDVKTVDISGRFVIPGLLDLHAHIQPLDFEATVDSPETAKILETLLDHGVTTVRALPLFSEFGVEVAARIHAGSLTGPTVIPSSGVFEKEPQRTTLGFGDPETAARWVEREAVLGTRWIKIYNSMDEPSLRAITETARKHGMRVCGHAEGVPPREAAEIGIGTIEHMTGIPLSCLPDGINTPAMPSLTAIVAWQWQHVEEKKALELMETLRDHGTGWVPTLVVLEKVIARGAHDDEAPIKQGDYPQLQEALTKSARLAVSLHRMGGLVGLGTDFPIDGVPVGESAHREMELLVERGGATPLEALQVATVSSLRILQMEGLVGRIEPDFLADLVVLEENPVKDISHTRGIVGVVRHGRLHRTR